MTFLLVTDESERDRIIAEIDAAYGYPHPDTLTYHAVMWTEHPDGHENGWIIPIPDTFIYSQADKDRKDLVPVLGDVVPDAGVTREVDAETGEALQPIALAMQQSNAAFLINPDTGRREFVRKSWWITEQDATDLGFFPVEGGDVPAPEPPIKVK